MAELGFQPSRHSLPELCQMLHESRWGVSDSMHPRDERRAAAYLEFRLMRWRDSIISGTQTYDLSVRQLVSATLAELRGQIDWTDEDWLGWCEPCRLDSDLMVEAVDLDAEGIPLCSECVEVTR